MKKLILMLVILIILPVAAANDILPIFVRPKVSGLLRPSTVFAYQFNFTDQIDCTNVILSVSKAITTDNYGIGFANLDISSLTSAPSYLCEYKDGTLRKVHNISSSLNYQSRAVKNNTAEWGNYQGLTVFETDAIFNGTLTSELSLGYVNVRLAQHASTPRILFDNGTGRPWQIDNFNDEMRFFTAGDVVTTIGKSGMYIDGNITANNMTLTGNLTIGEKLIFAFDEMIDNIIDGWLRITGALNVGGDLNVTGDTNVSGDINVEGNLNVSNSVNISENLIAGGWVNATNFNGTYYGDGSLLTGISAGTNLSAIINNTANESIDMNSLNITDIGYITMENDPTNHQIYDNSTCTIITGDTSTLHIC